MKVSTDACLFGAYIDTGDANTILDIGTGTGLIALMLAQRSNASIDAVDIDESAYKQARDNFNQSPWKDRLHAHHADIIEWYNHEEKKFDLVVSNPPFFDSHMKSGEKKKNLAKHSDALPLKELLDAVIRFLKPTGIFYLMLPEMEMEKFIAVAAKKELYLNKQLTVKNFKAGPVFRLICSFSFNLSPIINDEIVIWQAKEKYTERFMELLKEYYLYI